MTKLHWMVTGLLIVTAGCGGSDVGQSPAGVGGESDVADAATVSPYVASSEPVGAIPVGLARESIKDADSVTLVGTVGGSAEPFVEGLAAFSIVDNSVPSCRPEEGCPTPWDYCCKQDQVRDNIATVKVVDDTGVPVSGDAKRLLGIEELSTVVVSGTAERDDHGNLAISASQVFVRPGE